MIYWSCPGDSKAGYDEAIQQLERVDASLRSQDQGNAKGEDEGPGKEGILQMGYKFGPSWTNHWIKAVITIPEELRNVDQQVICTSRSPSDTTIRLCEHEAHEIVEFDPSCEALIFSSDGVPQHGMSLSPLPSLVRPRTVNYN
jgi:alpha-mannosidase